MSASNTAELGPEREAEDLWAFMGSQFERDLDPLGYSATFTVPVRSESANLSKDKDPLAGLITDLTGFEIMKNTPWQVHVEQIPRTSELGVTQLSLPLKSPDRQFVRLFRTEQGYVPFLYGSSEPVQLATDRTGGTESGLTIPEPWVHGLLAKANYNVERFTSHPDELRLALMGLADGARRFRVIERREVPINLHTEIRFEREVERRPESMDRRSIFKRRTAKRIQNQEVFITRMAGVVEHTSEDTARKERLAVTFHGNDSEVDLPDITSHTLVLSDGILGQEGSKQYTEIEQTAHDPTATKLQQVSEHFLDLIL